MTKKILSLIFLFLIISVLMSGCVQKATSAKMDKISERTDGSRHITGYADPVKKYIHVTVVENKGIADFGIEGLKKEILWLIPDPSKLVWESNPSIQNIDGHAAYSGRIVQVDQETGLSVNVGIPDWYITAIGYPEKDTILTILTNGDAYSNNVTWEIHNEMVNRFKL
jgi:hypothetical protein